MDKRTVFEKLDTANGSGEGITLTESEVWLLMELAGDHLGKVEAEYLRYRELFEDIERIDRRAARPIEPTESAEMR